MSKKVLLLVVIALVGILAPQLAQAQGEGGAESPNKWIAIACGFGLAFASAICGIAQSIAFKSAADGIARNPGAGDQIRGMLILGLAFIESLAIYVLLIAFMLYFKWA